MSRYLIERIFATIPVLLGILLVVAFMIHAIPGDPVDQIAGDFATEGEKNQIRADLGLDAPVPTQIYRYIIGVLSGDLGVSIIYRRPVGALIVERLPATIQLAILAILIAAFIGIPLGVLSALRQDGVMDYAAMSIALLGVAIPNFWLGPILIYVFSVQLGWLPVSEQTDWTSYILPAATLGFSLAAIISRMTRNSLLGTLSEDYIRTAKAKGLKSSRVVIVHGLRNGLLPVISIVGLQFGVLLTGTVITETIFDWPGLGRLIVEALGNRDYPLVQGCVLTFALTYVVVNFLTELMYSLADPRIRLHKSQEA